MKHLRWRTPTGCYERGVWCGLFAGSAAEHLWHFGLDLFWSIVLFLAVCCIISYFEMYKIMENENGTN